jgi:hypothetical protein
MNGLYVVSGCALILAGVALIVAAIVVFVMKRPRTTTTTSTSATAGGTLRWLSGPLAGQSMAITADGFYIGRDETKAAVVLNDARMSKLHLWIGIRDGRVMAIDPGSTNGTFRNTFQERISQTQLATGDTLIFPEDLARAQLSV